MKNLVTYFVLTLLLVSCASKRINHSIVVGNVYVFESVTPDVMKLDNWRQELDSIFPLLAFRVNHTGRKHIQIIYRLGYEASMTFSANFSKSCQCFESKKELPLAPRGENSSAIKLYFNDPQWVEITLSVENHEIRHKYRYTHTNIFNHKQEKSRYYQEQGFNLFSN